MKHSPQTDREESGTPTLLTTRKERRRRKKRKGSEKKKQTEVRGRIPRMGTREEEKPRKGMTQWWESRTPL